MLGNVFLLWSSANVCLSNGANKRTNQQARETKKKRKIGRLIDRERARLNRSVLYASFNALHKINVMDMTIEQRQQNSQNLSSISMTIHSNLPHSIYFSSSHLQMFKSI